MAATGQTINDRLNAFRYALGGQGLARTVCKATTEEVIGPKKKHIDYLVACTNEPNISIPQLANLLIERTQHTSWAVVFKGLISIHHLMSYGNEKFTQYLATSNHSFELENFMDRTTPQGYGMSTFVRRYAKYINQKSTSYRTLALDLCKIKSGNDNALRTMNMDNLSKTLPIVQAQFDLLLEFEAEAKDLNNGIIMSAFKMLYKDLVRMYVAYQEAIINLLERYFKLSRRKTREALEMYKNYLARMDKVANFLLVVETVGIDKSEMPDLTKSPASILEVLEKHLAQLEAKKRGATPASPPSGEEETQRQQQASEPDESKNQVPTSPSSAVAYEAPSKKVNEDAKKPTISSAEPPQPPRPAGSTSGGADSGSGVKKVPPARPSPIVSPKMSPSASRPAPSAAAEDRAPPERPAKPPSRPPPPAAAPTAPVAAQKPAPTTASTCSSAQEVGNQQEPIGTSPAPPPPHPPPPHSTQNQQASPPSPPPGAATINGHTTAPAAFETATDELVEQAANVEEAHPSDRSRDDSVSLPSCAQSIAVNEAVLATDERVTNEDESATASANESLQVDANHVAANNVADINHNALNNHEEMPPPPPPIDDEPVEHAQPEAQPAAVANGEDET